MDIFAFHSFVGVIHCHYFLLWCGNEKFIWKKQYFILSFIIWAILYQVCDTSSGVAQPFCCAPDMDTSSHPHITTTSYWARWRLKSPASPLFTQLLVQAQMKENIKAPRHWPLCVEFTGDRWIPRTNGQLRGKYFHLMASSWLQRLGPISHFHRNTNLI